MDKAKHRFSCRQTNDDGQHWITVVETNEDDLLTVIGCFESYLLGCGYRLPEGYLTLQLKKERGQ